MMTHKQQTIRTSVSFKGMGLFTGEEVTMACMPAPPDHGIVFVRTDLPGQPQIPALAQKVEKTPRCTILAQGEARVQMVEHFLAALRGLEIDNLRVEIDGPEIPIKDGSAWEFVSAIEKVGISDQKKARTVYNLKFPVFEQQEEVQLVALPSNVFKVSYMLSYPGHPLLDAQFYTSVITPQTFTNALAKARTFALYEEIAPLVKQGRILGGDLSKGVIIQGDSILNPEGVRSPDEMVRHKVVDLIGDLSLVGRPFLAHIIAVRSGHASNVLLAKKIMDALTVESA